MQNNSEKFKIDLKKRAYLYALDIIKFIDVLDKKDFTNFFTYALKSANESKLRKENILSFKLLFCALRFTF